MVPKETPPIPRLFIQELPGLSQFEELQLPDLPNCVSEHGFSSLILPKEGGISLQLVYMDSALIFSLQALSSQSASMDKEGKKVVFTNFIYPFLSRNDSSGNYGPEMVKEKSHDSAIKSPSFYHGGHWLS